MKTVNRGPQFLLDHEIIHRARLVNLTFLLLSNSWPPPPQSSLQDPPDPTFPTHSVQHMRKQNRGPFWTSAVLSNTNMASMYEIDSGVSTFDTRLRWKSTYKETPLGPGWRREHPRKTGGLRGFTKKMRQTAHSWLWDTNLSQHYKFLLDLCVCVRFTDLLLDHKNRGWSFH